MSRQVKIYVGSDTYEKWQKICERFSSNTAAFAVLVQNYFNQISQEDTMSTVDIAEKIYIEIFGDIDSKQFHARKVQEIVDWLNDGDTSDSPTVETLVSEWREYDAEEIAER